MKKLSIIIMILTLAWACKSKKNIETPLTAQVSVISEDANKTIEVRSIGFGKNENYAQYDSERKAFEILFFRGIPNSSIEQPLIGTNEDEQMAKHAAYFKNFFSKKYKSFIMSIYQPSPPQKHKGTTSVVSDIKINTMSLKKELEDQGIIRKFGF